MVAARLIAAPAGAGEDRDWARVPLAELCDHIVEIHHARLREELPEHLAPVRETAEVLTDSFTRARYAEELVSPETLADIANRLRELRRQLRGVKA